MTRNVRVPDFQTCLTVIILFFTELNIEVNFTSNKMSQNIICGILLTLLVAVSYSEGNLIIFIQYYFSVNLLFDLCILYLSHGG